MEIMKEYNNRSEKEESVEGLMKLALEMVPFFMKHNAEPDACDLMIELESLDNLLPHLDKFNFSRVALYLTRYLLCETSNSIPFTYLSKMFILF
jgi:26S proteasome regulatory subunit N1